MKKLLTLVITVVVLTHAAAAFSQSTTQAVQAQSAWTNQSGSTLYIDSVDPTTGELAGHYINRAAGYQCQNIAYPATGWVYGTAITFTVSWLSTTESCNSITAWTGFYNQGQIHTLWQLVINGSTSTQQIIQGSDTFSRNSRLQRKSLIPEK
jgi:opacity protein-like surface antigen